MVRFRIGIAMLALVLSSGCASLRMGRLEAYQALPLPADEFAALESYAITVVPAPFALHVSERGTAWRLLLKRADGGVELLVVTMAPNPPNGACEATVGELLGILPGDPARYREARALLVAHDGARCFGAGDAPLPCAASDAWEHAIELPIVEVTDRTTDRNDAQLRAWYQRAVAASEMVREENSSLGRAEWERIEWEESVWKDLRDSAPAALGSGVVAGAFSGVLPGIVVGGVTILVQLPFRLLAETTGPEYGDAPMPASAVAQLSDYVRRCAMRPREEETAAQ